MRWVAGPPSVSWRQEPFSGKTPTSAQLCVQFHRPPSEELQRAGIFLGTCGDLESYPLSSRNICQDSGKALTSHRTVPPSQYSNVSRGWVPDACILRSGTES